MLGADSEFRVTCCADRVDPFLQAVDLRGHAEIVASSAPWDRDPDGRKPLAGSGERSELEPGAAVRGGRQTQFLTT